MSYSFLFSSSQIQEIVFDHESVVVVYVLGGPGAGKTIVLMTVMTHL